ncbi:MAG: tRNA uridine(34) 5-carboxymethylaminomethyl modification radical SAM/GNAT enzyme Elp3 [Candidatus Micrarchaeia archaeon]
MKNAIDEITSRILAGEKDINKVKKEISKKYHLKSMPKNSQILCNIPKNKKTKELIKLLKRKPMRTSSGVSPIAVMIKPQGSCRHSCIYCPYTGNAPKSYTGFEPASLRAKESNFDPGIQVKTRLEQFKINGHPTDKCEVIIMGGTFLQTPKRYQNWFIKNIYDAMNQKNSKNLTDAKKLNETSKNRVIGLTIETRPDVFTKKDADSILEYGGTKIEFGVQNPDDNIYSKIKRGHNVGDVISATKLAKDYGFKVCYHLMPGLYCSNKKKDIQMIKKIFKKDQFKPDMLKIYPTLILKGTEIYELVKNKKHIPMSDANAVEIISEWYKYIPEYVRVMRIQRDIPSNLIDFGVKKSNLRELVEKRITEKKINIHEIRYRELGLNKKKIKHPVLKKTKYTASNGTEVFISFIDGKYLIGFIRLRIPKKSPRKEIGGNGAIVRELHIYGPEISIDRKGDIQHQGFGHKLLKEAEKEALKQHKHKLIVISGIGAREYYYKFGYKPDGPYVSKNLK